MLEASFNDGLATFTLNDSIVLFGDPDRFSVSTDAEGNIDRYAIGLMQPLPPHALGDVINSFIVRDNNTFIINQGTCSNLNGDICSSVSFPVSADSGGVVNYSSLPIYSRPPTGVWSAAVAVIQAVPVPIFTVVWLILLCLGISGVVLAPRQRLLRSSETDIGSLR